MVLTEQDIKNAKWKLWDCSEELAKQFHPVFEKNNWQWSHSKVPSISEIELTLNSLISALYTGHKRSVVSTGRIEIVINKESEYYIDIRVRLVTDTKIFGVAYPIKETA